MVKQVNTEKTVQNPESYFRTLTIQQLEEMLEYCERDFISSNEICEIASSAIERTIKYKKRYITRGGNRLIGWQCDEDIEHWENLKKTWEERLERARSRMRAAYRVMAQKELSHENQ